MNSIHRTLLLFCLLTLAGCIAISEASPLQESVPPDELPVVSLPTLTPLPTHTATASATPIPSATPSSTPVLTPTPDPRAERHHLVQQGENLEQIAAAYGVTGEALLIYNNLDDPLQLEAGQLLRVPTGEQSRAAMYATATSVAQLIPAATATAQALPNRVVIEMSHTYQGINNCAPSTTSMALSVFDIRKSQYEMAALQKPNAKDVNVTPEEVAASIREVGLEAFVGINGDIELVKRLLAAGFPVITEEWMSYDGGMGHFRAIRGYDEAQQLILYNDSFYGPGHWRSYESFLGAWKPFSNKYVVPYRPEQAELLEKTIGLHWNRLSMYESLRVKSQAEVEANPGDAYAWWSLGEALLWQGKPEEALPAFEQALNSGKLPWRYLWYRYGYFEALNRVGRHEELLTITNRTLNQMALSEDLRFHRAVALHALGRTPEAQRELERALQDNPRFVPAHYLLHELGGG